MFTGISHSKFDSQNFFADRENPVSGPTHHKRRVDFSLLPESQFYLLLHCRMHSGEPGQSVVLLFSNKGAAHQILRAKSQSVAEPRPGGTLSAAHRSVGVTAPRLQGFCNLLLVSGALLQKL